MEDRPVVVVGAGLAGLACARALTRRRVPVALLEASDRPGGVVRTDAHGAGFRIDRGFQVLLTAYPEARRVLDYRSLRLGAFRRGALVWSGGRLRRLADPLERPRDAFATLASGLVTPADAVRVLRMRRDVRTPELDALLRRPAVTARQWLEERGFSAALRERFFRPFLAGICLDPHLESSSRYVEFVMRMFAGGPAALPAGGMSAIPEQLAAALPPGTLRVGASVARVDPVGVALESGETIEASEVVVATDLRTARRWLPELPDTVHHPVWTLSFDAPEPPVRGPWLVLDGDGTGPVNHLAVPSEVSPDYAPAGRALVTASVLADPGRADLEREVRAQLGRWFGRGVERWQLLGVDSLPHALPSRSPASWPVATAPAAHPSGLFVAGAHRETTSIGGALRSGRRAAEAIFAARRSGQPGK